MLTFSNTQNTANYDLMSFGPPPGLVGTEPQICAVSAVSSYDITPTVIKYIREEARSM